MLTCLCPAPLAARLSLLVHRSRPHSPFCAPLVHFPGPSHFSFLLPALRPLSPPPAAGPRAAFPVLPLVYPCPAWKIVPSFSRWGSVSGWVTLLISLRLLLFGDVLRYRPCLLSCPSLGTPGFSIVFLLTALTYSLWSRMPSWCSLSSLSPRPPSTLLCRVQASTYPLLALARTCGPCFPVTSLAMGGRLRGGAALRLVWRQLYLARPFSCGSVPFGMD